MTELMLWFMAAALLVAGAVLAEETVRNWWQWWQQAGAEAAYTVPSALMVSVLVLGKGRRR